MTIDIQRTKTKESASTICKERKKFSTREERMMVGKQECQKNSGRSVDQILPEEQDGEKVNIFAKYYSENPLKTIFEISEERQNKNSEKQMIEWI